jgi:hypothetical protein
MALIDKALVSAGNVATNLTKEAEEELTGDSRRKWALVVIAFILGAAALAALIVLVPLWRDRANATTNIVDADGDAVPDPPAEQKTRWTERVLNTERAGVAKALRFPLAPAIPHRPSRHGSVTR